VPLPIFDMTAVWGRPWSPAQVPGIQPGIWTLPARSAGKLWQDATKTTPAVANADPVQVETDPYVGGDYTAPSSTVRPVLSTPDSGAHWLLTVNGTSTRLNTPLSALSGAWTVYAAVSVGSTSGNINVLGGARGGFSANIKYFGGGATWFIANDAGTTVTKAVTVPSGSVVIRIRRDASNVVYLKQGAAAESNLGTLAGTFTFGTALMCAADSTFTAAANSFADIVVAAADLAGTSSDSRLTAFLGSHLP